MLEANVDPKNLEAWAKILLNHSLGGVGPGHRVMIKGERIGWPLMQELERQVILAGAVPDVYLTAPNNDRGRVWSSAMGRLGSPEQIAQVPKWLQERFESFTHYVEVLGPESPEAFAGILAGKEALLAKANRPMMETRLAKPWVITLFPTPAFAKMEGMELAEYAAFISKASTADPRLLLELERPLGAMLDAAKQVKVESLHPKEKRTLQLTLDVAPSRAVMSYGLRNLPDGEVFTSPNANATEGELFLDLPIVYSGQKLRGIYLKFEKGQVVKYTAEEGLDTLTSIIETDPGSHRLGEVAFGMNADLDRALMHPLFTEKIGGTMHFALGASYEDCYVEEPKSPEGQKRIQELQDQGVLNRSAQHVDLVCDFRPGGAGQRVCVDDTELKVERSLWKRS